MITVINLSDFRIWTRTVCYTDFPAYSDMGYSDTVWNHLVSETFSAVPEGVTLSEYSMSVPRSIELHRTSPVMFLSPRVRKHQRLFIKYPFVPEEAYFISRFA